jgi:hypothetical protein
VEARVDVQGLSSIQDINGLPREMSQALYLRLVPPELLDRLAIDRGTLRGADGSPLVRITAPADETWGRVEVRASLEDRDPVLVVDVEMSPLALPELAFVQIADPRAPRYAIDRDRDGRDTLFGTLSRNLDEEIRAMRDGLAPGQVRRGLGMLGRVLECMEAFCRLMGRDLYLIQPLFYHSAILYERRGCGYLMGRELMESLHEGFAPAGALTARLDASTPFRASDAWRTVRGRSWALHDGILGSAWGGVKMYTAAGRRGASDTFPGGAY